MVSTGSTPQVARRTRSGRAEQGRLLSSLLVLMVLLFVGLSVLAFTFGTVVPVGSVGVRKIAFGPGQGLQPTALTPGLHWAIPGYSTIYEVPQTLRVLDFSEAAEGLGTHFDSLDIPTVDGTTVDVDASILYRFGGNRSAPNAQGGAVDLIQHVGATEAQWSKYISQVAENELKRSLSALSTVGFYDPQEREAQVDVARRSLATILEPLGVQVEAVLLRRYRYREEINQAIFKKNLQELESAYNKVAGEFAEAQRDVNKVESDGNVAIQNLEKQGIGQAETIRSEGDLYRREKYAQGDLLVAEARAAVDKMRGEVLSKGGGDVYVALQLAQFLGSLKGGVVANLDPYDFDGWIKRLGGALFGTRAQESEVKDARP